MKYNGIDTKLSTELSYQTREEPIESKVSDNESAEDEEGVIYESDEKGKIKLS